MDYVWIVMALTAVFFTVYLFVRKRNTLPWVPAEGFSGVVAGAGNPDCLYTLAGAGNPDCLYTLAGAAELLSVFEQAGVESVSEGPRDYSELRLILSKLACLKKDLMSPSGIVQATLYQPYATTHDREPVAETTARCFAKTIPARDLDISFETWRDRGNELLRRLCTAAKLSEAQASAQEQRFARLWADVYDVAKGACMKGEPSIAGKPAGPRDPAPYVPADVSAVGPYEGYY